MSRQLVSDKNEKSLGEMVIIILMVAVLMMSFIHYFFKQEDQITRAGFNALTQNFSTKITAVRAQWFMDKQPSRVQLISSGELQSIYVNKYGWIDSEQKKSACHNIWAIVMGESLHLMNVSIKVDEVSNTNVQHNRICKYSIPSGEFFQYNTNDGKVISAILINSPTQ
jgi:competence protein ComGC